MRISLEEILFGAELFTHKGGDYHTNSPNQSALKDNESVNVTMS